MLGEEKEVGGGRGGEGDGGRKGKRSRGGGGGGGRGGGGGGGVCDIRATMLLASVIPSIKFRKVLCIVLNSNAM